MDVSLSTARKAPFQLQKLREMLTKGFGTSLLQHGQLGAVRLLAPCEALPLLADLLGRQLVKHLGLGGRLIVIQTS